MPTPGVLSYALQLTNSSFLGPLGAATAAVTGFLGVTATVGGVVAKTFEQIEKGAHLRDLANQTGESVESLFKLERAFQIVGGTGQNTGAIIGALQRSLGGISEDGQPTAEIFGQLGLNIEKLKQLDAPAQIEAITAKLGTLDRASAANAAGKIFGRGNSADILRAARDSEDFADAMTRAADAAQRMQRFAAAFDRIDDALLNIKFAAADVFSGLAEGAVGFIEAFKGGEIGDLLALTLSAGIEKAINFFVAAFTDPALWDGIGQAALGAFDSLEKGLSKQHPILFRALFGQLGVVRDAAQTYGEGLFGKDAKPNSLAGGVKGIVNSLREAFLKSGGPAQEEFQALLTQLQARAIAAAGGGALGRGSLSGLLGTKAFAGIDSPLTRIGFGAGIGGIDYSRETATNTRRSNEHLAAIVAWTKTVKREFGLGDFANQ